MEWKQAFKALGTSNYIGTNAEILSQQWLDAYDDPRWVSLHGKNHIQSLYDTVGIVRFIINTGVDARSNMKLKLYSLDTNKEVFENSEGLLLDQKEAVKNFYRLIKQPNPLQSQYELLKQQFVYYDLFGDSFTYANAVREIGNIKGIPNVNNIQTMYNVPSQFTEIIGTGLYFDQTDIDQLIKSYKFTYGSEVRNFTPQSIFHRNDINISFDNTPTSNRLGGYPRILAFSKELSNIVGTLESRNVIIRKRGAEGIFTSGAKDALGTTALQPNDKKDAQKALQKYGTLNHQDRFVITTAPLQYQKITQNVKELQLLEGLYTDVISLSNGFNIPEILTKLYVQGGTFENQKEGKKRLYEENAIPRSNDWVTAFSSFLQLEKFGLIVKADFSHVPVLQENLKDESVRRLNNNRVYEAQFLNSSITWNRYLNLMGEPKRTDGNGDKYYYQLPIEIKKPLNGEEQV